MGVANDTCTTRAARTWTDLWSRPPRGASPDTFPRAPDRPHSPGTRRHRSPTASNALPWSSSRWAPSRSCRGGPVQAVRPRSLLRAQGARARGRDARRAVCLARSRELASPRDDQLALSPRARLHLRGVRHQLVAGRPGGGAFAVRRHVLLVFANGGAGGFAGARRRARARRRNGRHHGAVPDVRAAYRCFSLNRAPGGTFGNRNFMAHVCVIAFPAVLFSTVRATPARLPVVGGGGRDRRGCARPVAQPRGVAGAHAGASCYCRPSRTPHARRDWERASRGSPCALVARREAGSRRRPQYARLEERLALPRDGAERRELRKGSGHGGSSSTELLTNVAPPSAAGVGPGNWPVVYPKFASPGDPSLRRDGMTSNRGRAATG